MKTSDKRPATKDPQQKNSSPTWQPTASNQLLKERARMLKNIRAFFDDRSVLEVETPLLSQHATTDPHLDSLSSRFREQRCYLNTSPEYAMKRLLAANPQPIYQICKAFRDDELGSQHNPEFTMLEWYRPGFDLSQLMAELAALVSNVLEQSSVKPVVNFSGFEYLSYQQAFAQVTDLNPYQTTSAACYQFAVTNHVEIPQGLTAADDVDDWLDWLLTQCVLPSFKHDGFTFLFDYPASQCALAKIENNAQDIPVAKRFELFFGEVELANGFFELTDSDEQLQRFQQENQLRKRAGKAEVCIDENFIAALAHGLPACSGVALGLDRLLMVLFSSVSIEEVLSFSWLRS